MSAKLPSPLIAYVDFTSRNLIECDTKGCTICKESEEPDATFSGNVSATDPENARNLPHPILQCECGRISNLLAVIYAKQQH